MNDNELMLLLKEDNEEAFNLLYEKYKNSTYRYIISFIKDPAYAEDLFHEVFLSIYRNRSSYRAIASFKTYLFTVVRSKCIDFIRKNKTTPAGLDEITAQQIRDPVDTEKKLFSKEVKQDFAKLLDDMDEKKRSALYLKDIENLDYESIADILNIPVGTAKTLVRRGREKTYGKLRSMYV